MRQRTRERLILTSGPASFVMIIFERFCHVVPTWGAYLHYGSVLPDPLMEGGGKLFKVFKFLLCLSIKERMSWRWFGEDIIELRDIGDDRLLIRFGGINI